jgi:hypothetical protein
MLVSRGAVNREVEKIENRNVENRKIEERDETEKKVGIFASAGSR